MGKYMRRRREGDVELEGMRRWEGEKKEEDFQEETCIMINKIYK